MFENRTGCKKSFSSIQESAKSRNTQEEEVLTYLWGLKSPASTSSGFCVGVKSPLQNVILNSKFCILLITRVLRKAVLADD
jgi:hypothetical protein